MPSFSSQSVGVKIGMLAPESSLGAVFFFTALYFKTTDFRLESSGC